MAKVIVYHQSYGCNTGCCGHIVELTKDDGNVERSRFSFGHPYGEDHLEYAKDLVREKFGEEHVADLDWETCSVLDD